MLKKKTFYKSKKKKKKRVRSGSKLMFTMWIPDPDPHDNESDTTHCAADKFALRNGTSLQYKVAWPKFGHPVIFIIYKLCAFLEF